MKGTMRGDRRSMADLLGRVLAEAEQFIQRREGEGPVAPIYPGKELARIGRQGLGAQGALDRFLADYAPYVALNSGPCFYGYVIGGVTPAALAGDWLTSLYDQIALGLPGGVDRQVEQEAVGGLIDLLGLSEDMQGAFTSGATMATVAALAVAREWAGIKEGKGPDDGIYGLTQPLVFSGSAHASIHKGCSLLGIGRKQLIRVDSLPGREAVDVEAMAQALEAHRDRPCIVVANLGTSAGGDVDDLKALADLKEDYDFFLHVDGAIGIVAAASERYGHLFQGLDRVDSLTIDCHKWLNIPYDSGIALVQREHADLLRRVYAQEASVAGSLTEETGFSDLTNEGSRRWRALPVWMSLMAYGREGYAQMVEQDCDMARLFAGRLEASGALRLVSRPLLNGFAFTLNKEEVTLEEIRSLADRIRSEGSGFFNWAVLAGTPVLRCSLSNWIVEAADVERVAAGVIRCAQAMLEGDA